MTWRKPINLPCHVNIYETWNTLICEHFIFVYFSTLFLPMWLPIMPHFLSNCSWLQTLALSFFFILVSIHPSTNIWKSGELFNFGNCSSQEWGPYKAIKVNLLGENFLSRTCSEATWSSASVKYFQCGLTIQSLRTGRSYWSMQSLMMDHVNTRIHSWKWQNFWVTPGLDSCLSATFGFL